MSEKENNQNEEDSKHGLELLSEAEFQHLQYMFNNMPVNGPEYIQQSVREVHQSVIKKLNMYIQYIHNSGIASNSSENNDNEEEFEL